MAIKSEKKLARHLAEKKLIDELRTRNGNLEIMCARIAEENTQML